MTTYEWNCLFGACRKERGLKPPQDFFWRFLFSPRCRRCQSLLSHVPKKNPESSNSPFIGWSPTLIRLLYDPSYWTWPLLKLSWESFRSFGNQMMPTLPYFLGTRWVNEYLRSLVLHRSKIILKQNIEKRKNRSVWPFVLGNICVGVNLHFFFLLKFLR